MPIANKKKTIEERYKKLDEIDHILLRSGMYVGSVKNEQRQFFLWDREDESLIARDVEYCPALLKLIDEVISNSCDEYRRSENLGLNEVNVALESWVTDDGEPHSQFICEDNGGIPVVVHKDAGMYVPEMIFSQLRTSSNYDDEESRTWVGTNGVGAKLTGVFSRKFKVETADGKNSFSKVWRDNMRQPDGNAVVKKCKEHYTRLTYDFDMSRFDDDVDGFSEDFIDIVEKRCIDAAAANPGLKVRFTFRSFIEGSETESSTEWKFDSFLDYMKLFSSYINADEVIMHETPHYSVYVFPNSSLVQGFVNGVGCDRGTHIKLAQGVINDFVADFIRTKKKLEITPKEVTGKYGLFCVFSVKNGAYDSQTKENLTTPVDKFFDDDVKFELPKKFFDTVSKSEIIDGVIDWISQRDAALDQKKIRELNKEAKKKVVASEKYIPATGSGPGKILSIYEGNSAGAGFAMARPDASTYGCYLLRGVTKMTFSMKPEDIVKNAELRDLISIIGLDWSNAKDVTDPIEIKRLISNLNYSKIFLTADCDFDGRKVESMLIIFFACNWPWLFRGGAVFRNLTPLMICTKNEKTINIYSFDEFHEREEELKNFKVRYIKGLGGLDEKEFEESLKNPRLEQLHYDENAWITMKKWFGKNSVNERKESIRTSVE